MAKGSIVRRTRYTCCLCGKSVLLLARTVTDPAHVVCYDCATSTQPLIQIYNSIPTIPYEGDDEPIHTTETPWCQDGSCPCQDGQLRRITNEQGGFIYIDDQDETGSHSPDCRCGWCEPSESWW